MNVGRDESTPVHLDIKWAGQRNFCKSHLEADGGYHVRALCSIPCVFSSKYVGELVVRACRLRTPPQLRYIGLVFEKVDAIHLRVDFCALPIC